MKSYKILSAVGVLALTGASLAQAATTYIYITGAPAMRQTASKAIFNTLSSLNGSAPTVTADAAGGAYTGANQVNFTNLSIGGNPVIVKVSYVGSSSGIQSVAAGLYPAKYIPDGVASGTSALDPTVSGNSFDLQQPTISLSDTYQGTTPFNGISSASGSPVTYSRLTDNIVGIVPYKFIASKSAPAGLSNITSNVASQLFTAGAVPLSLFTDSHADESTNVYAISRDTGSGSRFIVLAETGIGVNTVIQVFKPVVSGGTITSPGGLYPAATVNGISYPDGDTGYTSFSGILAVETATSTPAVGYFISYVNQYDAATAIAAGAKELSFNGSTLSTTLVGPGGTAPQNLAEGRYTFWSYEHVFYKTLASGAPTTFVNALINQFNVDATVLLGDVNVGRDSDGGQVYSNPTY